METPGSNIGEWADFFERYRVEHPKIPGSALGSTINLELRLVNAATTVSNKHGKKFEYFKAVDTGRSAITADKGHLLAFADSGGDIVFRRRVKGTVGENITEKGNARYQATYLSELGRLFSAWAKTADENTILSTKLQSVASGSTKTPLVAKKQDSGIRYDNVVLQLINKSKIEFNPNKFIGKFGKLPSGAPPGVIQKIIKIPNWYVIAAIFIKVQGDQIEESYKPVTPSRKDSGKFKLAYAEHGTRTLELLPPSTGGGLRDGYKLVYSASLGRLING